MLNMHVITNELHCFEQLLLPIFRKSCEWFKVEEESANIEPSKISSWRNRMLTMEGQIIYCTSPEDCNEILGFVYTYVKTPHSNSKHIWLAACNPSFLRKGIMNQLFEFVEKNASAAQINMLTVNTYPCKFPFMYLFLEQRNYSLVDTLIDREGEKYSYSKKL